MTKNNSLCREQFVFQMRHSLDHVIFQLVKQINPSFEKNEFTLAVFVDLCKAFNRANHQILLKKKIEYYDIAGNNLRWIDDYLKDWKQFISFEYNSIKKLL